MSPIATTPTHKDKQQPSLSNTFRPRANDLNQAKHLQHSQQVAKNKRQPNKRSDQLDRKEHKGPTKALKNNRSESNPVAGLDNFG